MLLLGVTLAGHFRNDSRQRALASGRDTGTMLAGSVIEPTLVAHDLGQGLSPAEKAALSTAVGQVLYTGKVLGIRVDSLGGVEQWKASDDRFELPETPPDLLAAAQQHPVARTVTLRRPAAGSIAASDEPAVDALVALTPGTADSPVGVAYVLLPCRPMQAALDRSMHRFLQLLVTGLLSLYVVVALICWVVTVRLRRQAEENARLALHDVLTGLPNRALFHDRAHSAIALARRHGRNVAIVHVDLDRFREINDTLGHHNGDALLCRLGERLRHALREVDTVARLGGDELCLVLPDVKDAGDVDVVLGRVREAISGDLELEGLPLSVDASCGAALFPEHGNTVDELLQRAESPCTSRRPRIPACRSTTRRTTTTTLGASRSPRSCAGRSSGTSSSLSTNLRRSCRTGGSPRWRHWCAGGTRSGASSARTSSSRSPSRPG